MEKILLAQLFAHLLADFFLQTDKMSEAKQKKGLCSWHLWVHLTIVFFASLTLTPTCEFIPYAVGIAVAHWIIDYIKGAVERWMARQENQQTYSNHFFFFIDQSLHLIVIYMAVYLYNQHETVVPTYFHDISISQMLYVIGFLICTKPANIIIRVCLSSLNLNIGGQKATIANEEKSIEQKGLEKAGRWIGSFERILILLFVLSDQYIAIGFIITAKSILRFSDKEPHKTEYVLVGTFLSFCIAVIIGVALLTGTAESFLTYICNSKI